MKHRVIASMLIKKEDSYLFIRQHKSGGAYPDTLHIPGGGLEDGETPSAAVVREVREEVGLEVKDVEPVDFDWDVVNYKGEQTLLIFLRFSGNWAAGEVIASSDAKEARWIPADELGNHPHNEPSRRLLQRLRLL